MNDVSIAEAGETGLATVMITGLAVGNAKKYQEKANLGGKGTDTHRAVVVGDTVDEPFKDTLEHL